MQSAGAVSGAGGGGAAADPKKDATFEQLIQDLQGVISDPDAELARNTDKEAEENIHGFIKKFNYLCEIAKYTHIKRAENIALISEVAKVFIFVLEFLNLGSHKFMKESGLSALQDLCMPSKGILIKLADSSESKYTGSTEEKLTQGVINKIRSFIASIANKEHKGDIHSGLDNFISAITELDFCDNSAADAAMQALHDAVRGIRHRVLILGGVVSFRKKKTDLQKDVLMLLSRNHMREDNASPVYVDLDDGSKFNITHEYSIYTLMSKFADRLGKLYDLEVLIYGQDVKDLLDANFAIRNEMGAAFAEFLKAKELRENTPERECIVSKSTHVGKLRGFFAAGWSLC